MMGIASALVGVLPGTNTIGIAAPILLVVLRLLQGVAVGGEWSGSVLLSMEWGKQNKRGLMASWPQIGVPIGLLLGTGMMTLIALAAPDAFKAWAWRIPFLASLVLVAIGLWVRLKVLETPMFAQLIKKRTVSKVPVLDVIRWYPKEIVLSALLRMSEQAPFYLYTAFALTYIKDDLHKSTYVGLAAVTVGGALELLLIPTFGHLSDRLGRRRVYSTGAIVMGIVAFPFFLLLNTAVLGFIVLGTALIAIAHSMQYGPQSSYIAENFPTGLAYAGSGRLPGRLADLPRTGAVARDLVAGGVRLAGDRGLHHRVRGDQPGRRRPAAGPQQDRRRRGAGARTGRAGRRRLTGPPSSRTRQAGPVRPPAPCTRAAGSGSRSPGRGAPAGARARRSR